MLISCEKCSTTYVLDDALIPPQGAPVQCTRCGHIFTAKAPQPDITPSPAARPAPAWQSPELAGKPASGTLVFGGPGAPRAPEPAAAGNSKTMMFGTPAGQAREAGPPQPGAAQSQTMLFGGQGAPPPAAAAKAGQTLAFGAPAHSPAAPAGPAAQSNQTVIFGTPAVNQGPAGGAPVISSPRAAPAGSEAGPARTAIFGAGTAAPPPAASPANQTLVFGAATGAPVAPEGRSQTMMFGHPAGPKVTVGTAEHGGFAMGQEPSESTVRVDLDALQAAGRDGLTDDGPQVRHDRTVLFAGSGPPPAAEAQQNRTVLFAMNDVPAAVTPVSAPAAEPPPQTMLFGAHPGVGPATAAPSLDVGSIQPLESERGTAPELPHLDRGEPLELPPESHLPAALGGVDGQVDHDVDDLAVARLRAAANRRTTIAVIVFLVLALALAAALAWYLFGRALVTGPSAAIEAQAREAVALLRRDDAASHQASMASARALVDRAPTSVDARSALVLGTALAADDASAKARRERATAEAVKRRLNALAPAAPGRRELNDQLSHALETARASQAEAERLQAALRKETQVLLELAQAQQLPTSQQLSALRARSVSLAVQGEANSLAVAEEFNQKAAGKHDSWTDLALPEYVANGGSSFDEAQRQLEEVEARDDTFLRAYVLSARIALLRKDRPGAEAQLAKVLAFHPKHDAALALLDWVRSHRESND